MNIILSIHWILISAVFYFINGMLHDIAVIKKHEGGYDRELLRLLMNGHILMLSGIILFVCYLMMLNKIHYGNLTAIIIAIAMLVYCFMIFPFLKSFGTIAISILVIIVAIRSYLFSDI